MEAIRLRMRLLGKNHLVTFAARHSDTRSALAVWEREVEDATWTSTSDLKGRYPQASFVGGENVIFDIRGGNYRLHARVNFTTGIVIVVRVGTHSEYDKWIF
jgi:mRNA interferase HigB